jgi:DNA-binding phage protein
VALTREHKDTVLARIKRDPKFARSLYAEAVNSLLEGETEEGLSILRDLVHTGITFKELSKQTGLGEKALHRMLCRRGNPTARNLFTITKVIREDLNITPKKKHRIRKAGMSADAFARLYRARTPLYAGTAAEISANLSETDQAQ